MTLFGVTLDTMQVMALVWLLVVLLMWVGGLKDAQGYSRWFKGWEAERKARLDAEQGAAPTEDRPKTGPWG